MEKRTGYLALVYRIETVRTLLGGERCDGVWTRVWIRTAFNRRLRSNQCFSGDFHKPIKENALIEITNLLAKPDSFGIADASCRDPQNL